MDATRSANTAQQLSFLIVASDDSVFPSGLGPCQNGKYRPVVARYVLAGDVAVPETILCGPAEHNTLEAARNEAREVILFCKRGQS